VFVQLFRPEALQSPRHLLCWIIPRKQSNQMLARNATSLTRSEQLHPDLNQQVHVYVTKQVVWKRYFVLNMTQHIMPIGRKVRRTWSPNDGVVCGISFLCACLHYVVEDRSPTSHIRKGAAYVEPRTPPPVYLAESLVRQYCFISRRKEQGFNGSQDGYSCLPPSKNTRNLVNNKSVHGNTGTRK
jgi:hypothetical protein